MAHTMKLTAQQQEDIDSLVKQLESINATKSKVGKLIDIDSIKRDVDAKVARIKEVDLINKQWDDIMDKTIDADIESIKDDIEALGLVIYKNNTMVIITIKRGSYNYMNMYYGFSSKLDEPSGKCMRCGIKIRTYLSGNSSVQHKSIEEFASDERVIKKLKYLHEESLK